MHCPDCSRVSYLLFTPDPRPGLQSTGTGCDRGALRPQQQEHKGHPVIPFCRGLESESGELSGR